MILARVETRGVDGAIDRIEKRIFRLSGKDPQIFGDIQQVVYQSTATNFASQGRPTWARRSIKYEAKATWPILARTGKLLDTTLNSILRPWLHRGKRHFLKIFSIFYGFFHQYGRGQKVRKYVKIQSAEHHQIKTVIKKALHGN